MTLQNILQGGKKVYNFRAMLWWWLASRGMFVNENSSNAYANFGPGNVNEGNANSYNNYFNSNGNVNNNELALRPGASINCGYIVR